MAYMSLSECKTEMSAIYKELEKIAWDIKHGGSSGIGEQLCGDCVSKLAGKYKYVSGKLDGINQNIISALIEARKK
jgi:hypothetical protein